MLPVARSDVHVHLNRGHVEALFGTGYTLTVLRMLTIPGQFACNEQVTLRGPSGSIGGVYVVGPERAYTQVEVSATNARTLGLHPPLRDSGEIAGSPGCLIIGPAGRVELREGVIVSRRHIHMHTSDLADYGVNNGEIVRVRAPGPRGVIFENVRIKGGDEHALEMHIDFDEGYAAGVTDFQLVELLRE